VANVLTNLEAFEVLLAIVSGDENHKNVLLEHLGKSAEHIWWVVYGSLFFGVIAAPILKPGKKDAPLGHPKQCTVVRKSTLQEISHLSICNIWHIVEPIDALSGCDAHPRCIEPKKS
jgi:hypothetical protein